MPIIVRHPAKCYFHSLFFPLWKNTVHSVRYLFQSRDQYVNLVNIGLQQMPCTLYEK